MRYISTPDAPAAIGPYAQAVEHNGTVYVSGQIAIDPVTNLFIAGGISKQTEQVLKNLDAILIAAGCDRSTVLSCTVYLTQMEDFPFMNDLYQQFFAPHTPARATVQVFALPKEAVVEISCIAAVKS